MVIRYVCTIMIGILKDVHKIGAWYSTEDMPFKEISIENMKLQCWSIYPMQYIYMSLKGYVGVVEGLYVLMLHADYNTSWQNPGFGLEMRRETYLMKEICIFLNIAGNIIRGDVRIPD